MKHLITTAAALAWLIAGPAPADHHVHQAGDGHDHGQPAAKAGGKQEKKSGGKKDAKAGTVSGTVVDLACQVLGEQPDPGHKGCAELGVPVGIVDANGKLWIAIDANYGSATDELLPFMGMKVKATGWFVERKGERLISIASLEEVAEPGKGGGKAKADGKAKESWVCPHGCSTSDKPGKCACGLELVKKKR
jgi:hypothetical protein